MMKQVASRRRPFAPHSLAHGGSRLGCKRLPEAEGHMGNCQPSEMDLICVRLENVMAECNALLLAFGQMEDGIGQAGEDLARHLQRNPRAATNLTLMLRQVESCLRGWRNRMGLVVYQP